MSGAKPNVMTGRQARRALLLAMLLGLGFAAGQKAARAASFDCAKAGTARERIVCSDRELSKLDGQVGLLYRQAMAQLSPEGAQRLREGERKWLAYLKDACPLPTPSAGSESRDCLSQAYQRRVEDLKLAAVRVGPYLFTRIDLYSATAPAPASDDEDPDHSPALHHIAYPQIDRPADAAARQWNSLAVKADEVADCQDFTMNYQFGLATDRLISVTWTDWEYCHGTPHGHGGSHAENTVLTPTPRPLQPGDLFRPDRPWQAKLTALLRAAVEEKAREDGDADLSHLEVDAIAAAAASPKRWSLKEEGLAVAFDPYELGEGYPFAPEVTVPWSALKDVLAPAAPVGASSR